MNRNNRHLTNDLSSSNEVIVYRSRGNEVTDHWLYEDGGFVVICLIMLATAVAAIIYDRVQRAINRRST